MKRYLPFTAAAALLASTAMPAAADVAMPTVREGDFFCFRGMPSEQINVLPAREASRPMFRLDKLGNSKYDNTDGHDLREIPVEGDYPVLVILVEFTDIRFNRQWGEPNATVNDMLNSDNFTFQDATGSVNNYYQRVSSGLFNPKFDVVGPVMVSKTEMEYVTSNPDDFYIDEATGKKVTCYPAGRMVEEALRLVEGDVDFSKYDSDGDGMVDFVYLFFAGQGATTGGDRYHHIWPHAFTLNAAIGGPVEVGGMKVNRYCTSSELGSNRKLSGIGTFCHEFGHVLGLPDLYDTANNNGTASNCFSPGLYSNMDAGNYNNNEHTPPFFSSYEQYAMEWIKPASLSGTGRYTLLPIEARPFGYQLVSPNNDQEYFMLEARGNSFLDRYLAGKGLLVWHIDFNLGIWNGNTVNNNATHQRVDIIEADNARDESTRNGDVFPGVSGICEFTKNVTPSFKDWAGTPMGYDLREITSYFDGTVAFEAIGSEQIIPEAVLAAPAPKAIGADAGSITLEWPEVENATGYFVSVFDASKFNGSLLPYDAYAEGWYFHNAGAIEAENGICTLELVGLPSNMKCGIMIYAVNDLNASRQAAPIFASTVDGADFENASTNLRLFAAGDEAVAVWDEVEQADEYHLSVVKRTEGATTSSETLDFEGNRIPDTWTTSGLKFDNRKYGNAAPSVAFQQPGAVLQTPIFTESVGSLEFWACKRYNDNLCSLDVFALDHNGTPTLTQTITDLTRDGSVFNLPMPAATYGVRLVYNFRATDLHCYLDDLKINFISGHTDTPVFETSISTTDISEAGLQIPGLSAEEDYVAYLYPVKEGETGKKSNEVYFRLNDLELSGVDTIIDTNTPANVVFRTDGLSVIPSDSSASYDIIAADGTLIVKGAKGTSNLPSRGIYLIRSGASATKIII